MFKSSNKGFEFINEQKKITGYGWVIYLFTACKLCNNIHRIYQKKFFIFFN